MTLLLTLALASALLAQAAPDAITAVDTARAEAARDYASPPAAVAAYKRLERAREALLTSGDPRASIWYADAAEDAFMLGISADDCGLDALVGLGTPDARTRTGTLMRQVLSWTQRADELARTELAQGTATPALAARLESVERARRIPLLRSVGAIWAARVGALPAEDSRAVLESALLRLQSLAPQLDGPARTLSDVSIGLAQLMLGQHDKVQATLSPLLANQQADPNSRLMALVITAEAMGKTPSEQRRALASLRTHHQERLDELQRLLLGDADFRLASTAAATPPSWQGWVDAMNAAPANRRALVRNSVLERIATHGTNAEDPVVQVARALRDVRNPQLREKAVEVLAVVLAPNEPNNGAASTGARVTPSSASMPADFRVVAEFELGRAELQLGRARDGCTRLLRFSQDHPADPASRNAIDVAVIAARSLGDPALLATVLDTAVKRFPDHPEHSAWRVEAAALALSPDASLLVERQPAPRRYAQAVDALERADRTSRLDPAMRAELVVAAAEAANEMRHADDALALLSKLADPSNKSATLPGIPRDLRERMLEERIAALAIGGRSIDGDTWVNLERAADANATADACARVLRRQIPTDLASGLIDPPDPETRTRIVRLADATQRLAPPTPERDDIVVCALLLGQVPDLALPVARRVVAARGDRADALLALAECIFAVGDQAGLAESMQLHTRLARSATDGSPAWWVAELRRLQTLDRVNKNVEIIAPRVARLRAAHPDLGGPALQAQFLALAARHEADSRTTAAETSKD